MRNLNRMKIKSPLLVIDDKSQTLTANDQEQTEIIARYFRKQFHKNAKPQEQINPMQMSNPFTCEEVKNAIKKQKNNRSPGNDGITVEMLKYAPDKIYEIMAEIYNSIAETGDLPKELIEGILCAIQKPGKKKGPPENLRPIILLSIIRKTLAICIINRIGSRIDKEIPISQAAYRAGRSTTEHVFSTKMIIERTTLSKNETVHLILLDMSKAFDCLNRSLLIKDLKEIIDTDELHLIQKLLQVKLSVKCGKYNSNYFDTDTGAPQGDCASANEFTFYLAKSINYHHTNQQQEHDYHKTSKNIISEEHMEHNYTTPTQIEHITITQEYADDISKITSNYSEIQYIKEHLPDQLKKRDLLINESKTEEYTITKNNKCDNKWKKCKLLGSLLDTTEDMKRRKGLALAAITSLKHIFNNNRISISIKMRTFNAYITPVYLYNSELWCQTKTQKNSIDAFHRRLIRTNVLNVKWPKIVTNEQVYTRTNIQPWSIIIEKRRLRWFGHITRMSPLTPAKQALEYAHQKYKKHVGRPKQSWIKTMTNQLNNINLTWEQAYVIAQDREKWRDIVNM